jgi:hypothetical protein
MKGPLAYLDVNGRWRIIIIIIIIIRHDKVCTHLHYSICKKLGIETTEN